MTWWRRGVVYEIYPRSFLDTDGDGVGDLRGVTERLPYLRWLGVDAVWLTPFYPSVQRDFGYDITDHTAVDPQFGTLEDFDALVAAAHAQGLRMILDYVPTTLRISIRGSAIPPSGTGTCGTTGRRPTTG
jgi:alpha-glucosidase